MGFSRMPRVFWWSWSQAWVDSNSAAHQLCVSRRQMALPVYASRSTSESGRMIKGFREIE